MRRRRKAEWGERAMPLQALLFDVDGTLAETEEGHREAFNNIFVEAGLPWRWDQAQYRDLLRVTGGKERMLHHARQHDPERLAAVEACLEALHRAKNARFAQWMKASGGALRPGVRRLIEEASSAGLRLAVVTTTSRANLEALLSAAFGGQALFDVIVCGEDVRRKKPDPEAYAMALARLGLAPEEALAFEDSRNGLLAGRAAGVKVVVTPSLYSQDEDFAEADLLARDLDHAAQGGLTVELLKALLR
jgi:HAD superfamily hydrolase (TIGR01509 family)